MLTITSALATTAVTTAEEAPANVNIDEVDTASLRSNDQEVPRSFVANPAGMSAPAGRVDPQRTTIGGTR